MTTVVSTSVATAAVFLPSAAVRTPRCSALPHLPPPRVSSLAINTCSKPSFSSETKRFARLQVKAADESSLDTGELISDLKEKWDAVENKSTVLFYGGGAIVAIWLSTVVVSAVNSVPILPKIMELVGLGYTGWFVYKYLLFKEGRKELVTDIEDLKKKVAGTE